MPRSFNARLLARTSAVLAGLAAVAPAVAAELSVSIRDAAGRLTPAAVRLHDGEGHLQIPEQALDLGQMGYLYARGALIHYADWTSPRVRSQYPFFGSSWFRPRHPKDGGCFFVAGEFKLDVPAGRYRLVISKGLEYTPAEREIVIGDSPRHVDVTLVRWVDMAARGWHSGDGHVHIERASPAANAAALLWARAEDVRVCQVLLMGDARQTYYPQYGFDRDGMAGGDGTWLIAGQEDPRTRHFGHTLHFNPPAVLRQPATYYAYAPVFAGNHGRGLSGFAHVGRKRYSFLAERGLTLLAPAGLVDFAEIAQMGYIGVNVWYEFLNLGFRLTAMAGSDVPWGGTIGGTRVYACSGGELTPQRWLEAVRLGRTFVTTGPMLEFTVNGQLPGSMLKLRRGDRIRIAARTWSDPAGEHPVRLKLVSFGETRREVAGDGAMATELELAADRSFWVTAVSEIDREPLMDQPGFFRGAVATPVYIEVDGRPARDESHLAELVRRRRQCLDEIERWLDTDAGKIEAGANGGWESAEALRQSAPALRAEIRAARAFFSDLSPRSPP